MKEGWLNDSDYLILFDQNVIAEINNNYDIDKYLVDFKIIGIIGWDDFILVNKRNKYFRCPTVPLNEKYISEINNDFFGADLEKDERFVGIIKWHIQPIIFGGSPSSEENITWVPIDGHQKLVKWWNDKYIEVK